MLLKTMVSAWMVATIFVGQVYADDFRSLMAQGKTHYERGEYEASGEKFRLAEIERPEEPAAAFNYGTALYKTGDFPKAAEKFSRSANLFEPSRKDDAYYNLGNAFFKAQDFAKAIEAYRAALSINPDFADAKFNLELAKLRLVEQANQKENRSQTNQTQADSSRQSAASQKQGQQPQPDQAQASTGDSLRSSPEQNYGQAEGQKMTKDEAKNLLQAFADDEEQLQRQLRKFKVPSGSDRDW